MNTPSQLRPRPLPVRWLDEPPLIRLPICRREDGRVLSRERHSCRTIVAEPPRAGSRRPFRGRSAFTLLELMMVIAIIGIVATLALPHVRGFGQANSMIAATRQVLDDVAMARQRAMAYRTTVYMVFDMPDFWATNEFLFHTRQGTNMLSQQYGSYAIVTLSSVGDQPGQHYPRYITDWRRLPEGVFISPIQFTNLFTNVYIYTTNTLSGTVNTNLIQPWARQAVPFPSIYYPNTNMSMPCIAFSPQGGLATTFVNQYIVLARGSIFYPTDTNGAPLFAAANLVETPPGNDTNNANLIQIDWMTGRPTVFRNQLQ
ncbi:MAG TPA: prepilin-type N-terminal cleavage/methylation domain-containing protein [Verrucomicrobiae bacterium]|jgi:prepilin-type N-terminal cleavage/methylation domain-containing protein